MQMACSVQILQAQALAGKQRAKSCGAACTVVIEGKHSWGLDLWTVAFFKGRLSNNRSPVKVQGQSTATGEASLLSARRECHLHHLEAKLASYATKPQREY